MRCHVVVCCVFVPIIPAPTVVASTTSLSAAEARTIRSRCWQFLITSRTLIAARVGIVVLVNYSVAIAAVYGVIAAALHTGRLVAAIAYPR